MKNLNTYNYLMVLMVMVIIAGCGSDKGTPKPDVQAMLTSGTWTMTTVTIDGVNKNSEFEGLTISFTKNGFTAVGGAPVWPQTGTWTFTDAERKSITRGDGTVVDLQSVSQIELILAFRWNKTTLGGGRDRSLEGDHVFVLGR